MTDEKQKKSGWKKIAIILLWLLVWQLVAKGVDNPLLLVGPIETVWTLLELAGTKMFWLAVGGSLVRIAAGFLLGMLTACLLAVCSVRFPIVEEVLKPVITLMKAVPVASFVVLLLIWWGSSYLAVAICFLVVLPIFYINLLEGIKSTDRKLCEMARIFAIPAKSRFFYIYRPALRPFWESGLKLALGMCWKSGVAAEVIGTPAFSIGERMYLSKIYLDTAGVLAWTVVVIALSVCFEKGCLKISRKFMDWCPTCRPAGVRRTSSTARSLRTEKGRKETQAGGEEHAGSVSSETVRAVRCENVSKSYGKLEVWKNYSAEYLPGETYRFTEPSGSGKTTLFRMLCGLERPDLGEISFPQSNRGIQRGSLFSYDFQEDRLCEDYSAVRNVELVTGTGNAREALAKLLPEEALDKPCRQLSGGMRRRVALVRAMEAVSDYVILDEPFAGMDDETKARAEAYIRERQNGRTIFLATHR